VSLTNEVLTAEAWGRLYDDVFPTVYQALVAVLLDRDAARDAIHDAFVEGLRRPPQDTTNLAGWIYRVALRKARRVSVRNARGFSLRVLPAASDGEIDRTLDQLTIGRLLLMLSQRQREIVVAHYFLGLTQREIAQQLGIQRGTVGATIAQALARMRVGGSHAI